MSKAVFGLADSQEHADRIAKKLYDSGFSVDEISVLFSNKETLRSKDSDIAFDNPNSKHSRKDRGALGTEKHTKAPEGGVTGATAGGIIGGTLGLLAGIGALAIPGVGPFIAAGPIMGALAGSALGGSMGLLLGTLVGLGIPEYEAKKYETSLKQGGFLIAAHTEDSNKVKLAQDILKKEGAHDISVTREKTGTRG